MEQILKEPLFELLNAKEKLIVRSNSSLLTFDHDETIFKKHGIAHFIYLVKKGYIKLVHKGLYDIAVKGEFIGLDYLFTQSRFDFSAIALKDAEVLQINADVFRNLMPKNPNFFAGIFNETNKHSRKIISRLLNYRNKNVPAVLAQFLLEYSKENIFTIGLTRKEIAELTGYSRENITNTLKRLANEGYLTLHDDCIVIADAQRLKRLYEVG